MAFFFWQYYQEPYLEPNQKSVVEIFCKNSWQLLAANYVACKEKGNKFLYYFTYFYIILYNFDCPAFVDIKQTALQSRNIVNIIRDIYFLCILPYVCFLFLCWIMFCNDYFRWAFFHLGDKKSGCWLR